MENNGYPSIPEFGKIAEQLTEYARLRHEEGAQNIAPLLAQAAEAVENALAAVQALPISDALARLEPDDLSEIRKLRPAGPRKMWDTIPPAYQNKLAGAFMARMAGCTLGAIVEFWPIEEMKAWAAYTGDAFPPVDYWSRAKDEAALRYQRSPCIAYTRAGMDGVPVDDDITYTQLGLLIAEDYGTDFDVQDVGKAWLRYLPYACTAEDVALKNLRKGIAPAHAAEVDNPYCQWIGADIRSDPFAYMAPGYPEKAASMAYHDAYISHRRNGIYGEMFFAAAQAAAFAVDDPLEAIRIGLTEIPADCLLAQGIRWALEAAPGIHNYQEARDAVDAHFAGMSGVHTINNACLVVFGLAIGGTDVTRVLSEVVAMGLDNDCTAATAGSIVGAIVGIQGVPQHWTQSFNNRTLSYLNEHPEFAIDDLLRRFAIQANRVFATGNQ